MEKKANIENITSTKIIVLLATGRINPGGYFLSLPTVPNIETKNGIVNITGNGVINSLSFNGNVNSADSNYKVYRAVFN